MTFLLGSVLAAGTIFTCTPTHVWDGDGPIWCAEGPKIRLSGIATREIETRGGQAADAGCIHGHPCPTADGVAARDHLVQLIGTVIGRARSGHIRVRAPTIRCISRGSGGYGRTGAICSGPTET